MKNEESGTRLHIAHLNYDKCSHRKLYIIYSANAVNSLRGGYSFKPLPQTKSSRNAAIKKFYTAKY